VAGGSVSFAPSSLLPDQDRLGHSLSPALRQDMARMFRQLGVQQLRASVADTTSMASQIAWSLSDMGQLSVPATERNLDSVFPGASATISGLPHELTETTQVQKLSPRLWGYAWRVDGQHAIVAEVQYRERRDSVSETDTALVRLVCSAVIRAAQPAGGPPALGPAHALVWPAVERRAFVSSPRASWVTLALSLLALAACLWLAVVGVPKAQRAMLAQQEQLERVREISDATLVSGLSQALATGDYGDMQSALSSFASLGYFESAVVTNANGKVVATAGAVPRQRIGDPVNAAYAATTRSMGLAAGPEGNARLLLAQTKTASHDGLASGLLTWVARLGMGLSFCLALIAALAAFRSWRTRPHKRTFSG
jgi:hypothetical protein